MKHFVVLVVLAITACDSGPGREPVVIYAHGDEASGLAEWFAGFTDESGIPVTIKYGDSATITNNVIGNRGSPPADVLLTSNVADIWRAADKGALRPIQAVAMDDVRAVARDADGFWVAFDKYFAAIGQAERIKIGRVGDYADMAHPQLKGELCLSSSALPINRAVIALLMVELGEKEAEHIVRGWVGNLALPPFATESELIAALESGTCGYGVFSSSYKTDGIKRYSPEPYYFNIEGLGVARHARNPESAQALINWTLTARLPLTYDPVGHNIGVVGWRDEDARLLAERARYR